jgi:hypothetical protein
MILLENRFHPRKNNRCTVRKGYLLSKELIASRHLKSLDAPNRKEISMSGNDSPLGHTEVPALADEITPRQLARTKPLPVIIDIREERQFWSGHIAGAEHITRDELELKVARIAPELTTPSGLLCYR